jgi:ABC-type Fe3+/spermidine/putrescine transport system ATPase subunit
MLEIQNIRKSYDHKPLLNGINLEVQDGETICLLGASGSGKSTLLQIIAGLEPAESGRILWDGKSIDDLPPHRRGFGLMFQDYALFPHLDVAKNVAFGLEMQKMPLKAIRRRVEEVLELVHMTTFSRRSVLDLSGGEQQRVALARTLAPAPRLVMLDEPMAALDRSLRTRLTSELRGILRSTGIPAIYVTHDQQEAFTIGDRIALIQLGQIVQTGTPEEVYSSPCSPEAARFFGLTNLIKGTVRQVSPLQVETEAGTFTPRHVHRERFHPGEDVQLLLRPDARLEDTTGVPPDNSIRGVVTDCIFQENGYLLRMREGKTGVEYSFGIDRRVQIGDEVTLRLDAEQIHAY